LNILTKAYRRRFQLTIKWNSVTQFIYHQIILFLIHGKKLIKYIGWIRIIQSYVSRIFMLMSHTMCNQLLLAVVLPDKRHYSWHRLVTLLLSGSVPYPSTRIVFLYSFFYYRRNIILSWSLNRQFYSVINKIIYLRINFLRVYYHYYQSYLFLYLS
jgi:hypothetical protein